MIYWISAGGKYHEYIIVYTYDNCNSCSIHLFGIYRRLNAVNKMNLHSAHVVLQARNNNFEFVCEMKRFHLNYEHSRFKYTPILRR